MNVIRLRGLASALSALGALTLACTVSGCGEDKPSGKVVSASKRGADKSGGEAAEKKEDPCEELLKEACKGVEDCSAFTKTFKEGLAAASEDQRSMVCRSTLSNEKMLKSIRESAKAAAGTDAPVTAKAEPAKAEPAKAEPAKAEPAKAEPAKADGALTGACADVVAAVCKAEPKCDAWKQVFAKGMASVGDSAEMSCKAILGSQPTLDSQITAAKGLARAGAVVTPTAAGGTDAAAVAAPAAAAADKPEADAKPEAATAAAAAAGAVAAKPTPAPPALPPLPAVAATPIEVPAPAPPKLADIKVVDSKLSKGEFKCSWGGCKAQGGITAAHAKVADGKMKWDKESIEFRGKGVTNADIASIVALKDKVKHLRLMDLEGVTDISPIGHLANLESLEVSRSKKITDYSTVLHLKNLKKLRLNDLASGNLDFMANLKALEEAKVSSIWGDTHLTNIKGLAGASNLTKLEIRAKEVTDIGALANLPKLEELYLWVKATDLKPLVASKGSMKKLDLYAVPTEDLSPVAQLSELESLYVYMTKSATNPLLGHLKKLKRLDATMAKFDDLKFVKHLPQLAELDMWNVKLDSWEGLEYLKNLKDLDIADTNVPDLTYIVGMTGLTKLDMRGMMQIKDLNALAQLKGLEQVDIEGCNAVTTIEPLAGLSELKRVTLSKTVISDLTPLKGLTKLESLYLADTKGVDLKAVEASPALRNVTINGAEGVKNLEALKAMPALKSLTYTEGQLPEALVADLKAKKVWLSARKPRKK